MKFFIHLMNLEVNEPTMEAAGTKGCLDIVTMHIMDFVGEHFQMGVTDLPVNLKQLQGAVDPYGNKFNNTQLPADAGSSSSSDSHRLSDYRSCPDLGSEERTEAQKGDETNKDISLENLP